jgi:16S rRNA processing protein RimM
MIRRTDVFPIGHFYKTHGISGELAFSFTTDVFDRTGSPYWVLEIDGVLIPFFVLTCKLRSDSSALVRFEGIVTEQQAKELIGKDVFYPVLFSEEDEPDDDSLNGLFGFKVEDKASGDLGEIIGIEDSTINVLIIVSNGENEVLIPIAGDYITKIDAKKRVIHVDLPDGYLDL